MANQYYIGGGSGYGFGSGGNVFSHLGQIGPSWRDTQTDALRIMQNMNDFQNSQLVEPYKVQAAASAYGTQALNNQLNSELLKAELLSAYAFNQIGSEQQAEEARRRLGVNSDTVTYGATVAQNPPPAAQPSAPANTGAYAATSPQQNFGQVVATPQPVADYLSPTYQANNINYLF